MADISLYLSFSASDKATDKGEGEGFGIALLEANALGIPTIGALGSGIEDAIADGVSGKLIENADIEGFGSKLVLDSPSLDVQSVIAVALVPSSMGGGERTLHL